MGLGLGTKLIITNVETTEEEAAGGYMDNLMYYHPCIVNRTAPGRVCPLPGDGEPPLAARPAPAPHLLPRLIPGPRLLGPGETW